MSVNFIGRRAKGDPAELMERIQAEGEGEIVPLPMPWPSLHRAIGFGLRPGNILVLAGAPGAAKSLMMLNLCLFAGSQRFRWKLLPLEDSAERWVEKAMAVHFRDWKLTGNPEEDTDDARKRLAEYKLTRLASERDLLALMYEHICENPRVLASGDVNTEPVPFEGVLEWVQAESNDSDLIVIDPVAQIDFSGREKDWKQQERFVQQLTGIAEKGGCNVILVAHMAKRPGRISHLSTMEDLQGAAAFARLAQYVFLLDRHDPMEADVFSSWNSTVDHKLTLTVGKARDGFSGTRIAMDLHQDGPVFREHGIIKPKVKRQRGKP